MISLPPSPTCSSAVWQLTDASTCLVNSDGEYSQSSHTCPFCLLPDSERLTDAARYSGRQRGCLLALCKLPLFSEGPKPRGGQATGWTAAVQPKRLTTKAAETPHFSGTILFFPYWVIKAGIGCVLETSGDIGGLDESLGRQRCRSLLSARPVPGKDS